MDEERYDIEAKCLHNTREVSLRWLVTAGRTSCLGVGPQVATMDLGPPLLQHQGDGSQHDRQTEAAHINRKCHLYSPVLVLSLESHPWNPSTAL